MVYNQNMYKLKLHHWQTLSITLHIDRLLMLLLLLLVQSKHYRCLKVSRTLVPWRHTGVGDGRGVGAPTGKKIQKK